MTNAEKIQSLIDSGIRIEQIAIDLHCGVTTIVGWLRHDKKPRLNLQHALDAYYGEKLARETK